MRTEFRRIGRARRVQRQQRAPSRFHQQTRPSNPSMLRRPMPHQRSRNSNRPRAVNHPAHRLDRCRFWLKTCRPTSRTARRFNSTLGQLANRRVILKRVKWSARGSFSESRGHFRRPAIERVQSDFGCIRPSWARCDWKSKFKTVDYRHASK